MAAVQEIVVAGQKFVLIPKRDYEHLCAAAAGGAGLDADGLPAFPPPDKNGHYPALESLRISLARDIIRDRRAALLTQAELAKLAKTRPETISRIESGSYSASPRLIDRIDGALKKALAKKKGGKK